jgi:signal transduction histidine kinase
MHRSQSHRFNLIREEAVMLHLSEHGTGYQPGRGKGKYEDTPGHAVPAIPALVPQSGRPGILLKSQLSPLVALAHDARNVLAALQLYSELVAEPGVLTPQYRRYADEIRAISQAGTRLVEQISILAAEERLTEERLPDGRFFPEPRFTRSSQLPTRLTTAKDIDELFSGSLLTNLPAAVRQMFPLLTAITGPAIHLEMECLPCPGLARLTPEDLTRILVNLVRNAADAMPQGGHVRVTVQQAGGASFLDTSFPDASSSRPRLPAALISVQDDGPGIPSALLDHIFDSGFTTRLSDTQAGPPQRGFGLAIVRGLVESAGGAVRVLSHPGSGSRFEIELPLAPAALTNVTPVSVPESHLLLEGGRQ